MVARLSVSSHRCAGCGTDICCAGPRWSLLRPIVRLSKIEGHGGALAEGTKAPRKSGPALAARPQLRATEQGAGGDHQGAPKNWTGTAIRGAEISARAARPQLRATEQGAGGGYQGAPKKRPGTAIRGAEILARAARPELRATEQGAGGGHQGAPKKRPGTAIHVAEIPARAHTRCQTEIVGLGAACW